MKLYVLNFQMKVVDLMLLIETEIKDKINLDMNAILMLNDDNLNNKLAVSYYLFNTWFEDYNDNS